MPNDAISDQLNREDIPALVRFERVAVENKAESIRQGKWVGVDVDMVHITPPYSKDEVTFKVTTWHEHMVRDVAQGRMLPARRERYLAEYEAWKKGQELPMEGTPIKGWGMISPAQQKALLESRIYTVEMLAHINDEGMKRVGMGSIEMKQKAITWLAQNGDRGPLTIKMAALDADNRAKTIEINTLKEQVEKLAAMVEAKVNLQAVVSTPTQEIPVESLIDKTEPNPLTPPSPVKRHRRTKAEMEAARQPEPTPEPAMAGASQEI